MADRLAAFLSKGCKGRPRGKWRKIHSAFYSRHHKSGFLGRDYKVRVPPPCVQRVEPDIYIYQLIFRPLVTFCTSKILRIFQVGKITVFMIHEVAPQILVCCTLTIQVNGQFLVDFPSGKSTLLFQARQHTPFLENWWPVWGYVLCLFLYDSPFYVGAMSERSRAYACMISSPVSAHACFSSDMKLGTQSLRLPRIPLGFGCNTTIKNDKTHTVVRCPVIE